MSYLPEYTQISVDGQTLYVADLDPSGLDGRGNLSFSSKTFGELIKPITTLGKALHEEIKKVHPDETELTMQLTMGIDNGNIFFGLANMSAEAQLAVKFVWKKGENETSSAQKVNN